MTTEILVPVKMKRVYCFLSFPLNAMKVLDRVPIWGLWKVNVSRQNGKGNKSQGSTEMAVSCPIFSSDLSMPEFKVSLTPGVYTGCTQISKKCHLFIVWCVGKGFSEWERVQDIPWSECVCMCARARVFSTTPATMRFYSSAQEPAAGKASKIRRRKTFSNQRNCALRALEGSLLLISLSCGHCTQKADVVELCDREKKIPGLSQKTRAPWKQVSDGVSHRRGA